MHKLNIYPSFYSQCWLMNDFMESHFLGLYSDFNLICHHYFSITKSFLMTRISIFCLLPSVVTWAMFESSLSAFFRLIFLRSCAWSGRWSTKKFSALASLLHQAADRPCKGHQSRMYKPSSGVVSCLWCFPSVQICSADCEDHCVDYNAAASCCWLECLFQSLF